MKRIFLLTISLSLLCCSPTKKITKSEVQTEQNKTEVTTTSGKEHTESTTQTLTDVDTNHHIITIIKVYDTSQPVDTITGKPPLMSETTQKQIKSQQIQQTKLIEQNSDKLSDATTATTEQKSTTTNIQTKEIKGVTILQKILMILGPIVILLLLYGVVRIVKGAIKG